MTKLEGRSSCPGLGWAGISISISRMRRLRLRTLSVSSQCITSSRLLTQSGDHFFLWACRSARPALTKLGWARSASVGLLGTARFSSVSSLIRPEGRLRVG